MAMIEENYSTCENKEFHIWFNNNYPKDNTLIIPLDVYKALDDKTSIIHTTCLHYAHLDLILQGYRIFIHPYYGEVFEVAIGDNKPYTNREIHYGHNLEKLLLSGEFDSDSVCVVGWQWID